MAAISRVTQVLYREFRKDRRGFAAFRRWLMQAERGTPKRR
jgi:hypothetical protein